VPLCRDRFEIGKISFSLRFVFLHFYLLFTWQILQLVCATCGKPCRTETEKEMHTRRNPGHDTFVDKTNEQAGISYGSVPAQGAAGAADAGGDVNMEDMDEETKKALAMSMGVDPSECKYVVGRPERDRPATQDIRVLLQVNSRKEPRKE
jgi:hypothetical protein